MQDQDCPIEHPIQMFRILNNSRVPCYTSRIETIDEPHDREKALQLTMFDEAAFNKKAHRDDFRNMLIWGDNKLAMASLLEQFRGKVDLIYIDPPYNTFNENWVYNDNASRPQIRAWLGEVAGDDGGDLNCRGKSLCTMNPACDCCGSCCDPLMRAQCQTRRLQLIETPQESQALGDSDLTEAAKG